MTTTTGLTTARGPAGWTTTPSTSVGGAPTPAENRRSRRTRSAGISPGPGLRRSLGGGSGGREELRSPRRLAAFYTRGDGERDRGGRGDRDRGRGLLRPLRRRDQRRPVPDVQA